MIGPLLRRAVVSVRRALGVLLCALAACLFMQGSSLGGLPPHPTPPVVGVPPSPNDPPCPSFDAATLPSLLPAGTTPQAGSIAGSFSVSAGGEATYGFPITVPPGRLGMEPRLSIAYGRDKLNDYRRQDRTRKGNADDHE